MSSFGGTIHHDELLWLLGSLSGLYRLPFDAALVAQSFPPPCDHAVLREAARSLGFKTGTRATGGRDWQKLPLPVVGFLVPTPETNPQLAPDSPSTNQSAAVAADPSPHTLHIILKIEGDVLLYFRIGSQVPEAITTAEAAARLGSELILVGKETATGDDEVIPGFPVEKKPFGFAWFIPERLKHEKIWRDILFASLAIQLVVLTNPLFTQVIIDKVIAHQNRSALIGLGFSLIIFMLFNLTMTWLRQYLVLHTGNCIDAELDSKISRHCIPGQLKMGIKSLLKKQGQKQQQKTKAKVEPGQRRSVANELECAA